MTAAVCTWDSGTATGCRSVCDLPATRELTHDGYRGPYVTRLCDRHAAALAARVWPYAVTGDRPVPAAVVWSDSDGHWHASVPVHPREAGEARRAIRDAVAAAAPAGTRVPLPRVTREGYASGSLCTRVIYGTMTP